jgi:hypothetical protein
MPKTQERAANDNGTISAERAFKPKWFQFPDELPNGEFRGFENRKDATQVRGAWVLGQNVRFRDSGLPNLREGYSPIGTEATDSTPVGRGWVFETREGDVYELKEYDGGLHFFLVGTSTEFSLLKSGFTKNKEFGYANIGESGGAFHTFFCNGVDAWQEWNGAHASVASVGAATITKSGATAWNAMPVPFYSSGVRKVMVNGIEFTYTGGDGTDTITGVSPNPVTSGITSGMMAVQSPRTPSWRVYMPFLAVSTGTFHVGDTITGVTSANTATVARVAQDNTFIVVENPSGVFTPGETIGNGGGATVALAGYLDSTQGPPLASIITSHLSRIHCWSAAKRSVWAYSVLDDPYCWSVFAEDTAGGRKDIDFGGAGTAFGRINQTVIGYKKRGIVFLNFVQTGQRTDVPVYTPLLQSDDKGTTLGAISQRSTFSSPFGMISITVDARMILLTGISDNNQPAYFILSDPIQPVFNMGDHNDASGICVDGVLWYSFKSSASSDLNDTVMVGDLRRKTVDAYGNSIPLRWDLPTVGWFVRDWTAVPDGMGGASVHWQSSLNSNTYNVDPDSKQDDNGGFTASARTWSEYLGAPLIRKKADRAFVEILMRDNSDIDATLLLDEEGSTARIVKNLKGTDTGNRFGNEAFNPLGSSIYGSQRIGSNGMVDDRRRYRYYFELKGTFWFFTAALQFDTDAENSDFEVVRFGIHVVEYEKFTPKALAK